MSIPEQTTRGEAKRKKKLQASMTPTKARTHKHAAKGIHHARCVALLGTQFNRRLFGSIVKNT
jgi:hypothetical protein